MTTTNALTTPSALEGDHVKGFVSSYGKCWEHYEAYMQDPDHTHQGFIAACKAEAAQQGIEIQLPAPKTFANRTTRLIKAGAIPERTMSDNPEAVKSRKRREKGSNSRIGKMTPTTNPLPANPYDRNDHQVSVPVQCSNTKHLLSRDVPAVQPNVGICCNGRAEAVEALGTDHEGANDAKRTYVEICQLLDQACSKLYELENYPIDDSVWASVRGHINACAAVADCHRVSEDVLPLRNITND